MNRTRWLILFVVLLVGANVGWRIWKGWGLITIHSEDWPVSKIVREIESQGHVTVKTNLDLSTQVRMNVNRVPVSEALEVLAIATDSRWRLAYVFGQDKGQLNEGVTSFAAGERPEGWRTAYVPLGGGGMLSDIEFAAPPDPRRDTWNVQSPEEKKLQSYLEQGARSVYAAFIYPESWNPDISRDPKPGEVRKVAPALAKEAGGQTAEVFLLTKMRPREDQPEPPPEGDGEPRRNGRDAFASRIQAEVDKLPKDQRERAQSELDERRKFADLSDDERRARRQAFMEDPSRQERMAQREAERDARSVPERRMQRAQRYLQNKKDYMNSIKK